MSAMPRDAAGSPERDHRWSGRRRTQNPDGRARWLAVDTGGVPTEVEGADGEAAADATRP